MREYNWSWSDYQRTPLYVRRVCWDLMVARREAEHRHQERQQGGDRG